MIQRFLVKIEVSSKALREFVPMENVRPKKSELVIEILDA
jgi:hypothetical protein